MDPEVKALLHDVMNNLQVVAGRCSSLEGSIEKLIRSIETLARKLDESAS